MNYDLSTTGMASEVILNGRLTFADYTVFKEITDSIQESTYRNFTINLKRLDFIDSAGLGMLLIARDKAKEKSGYIILKGAQGQVKKMLDLGKFEKLFSIET